MSEKAKYYIKSLDRSETLSEIRNEDGDAILKLSRSDMGDGGWSLHRLDEPADECDPLLSGESEWIEETDEAYGRWARPNKADIELALSKLTD